MLLFKIKTHKNDKITFYLKFIFFNKLNIIILRFKKAICQFQVFESPIITVSYR